MMNNAPLSHWMTEVLIPAHPQAEKGPPGMMALADFVEINGGGG